MANAFDITLLDLNPKEVTEFSKFIAELTYMKPELKALHAVDTGVTMKQQIVLASLFGKMGIKADTSCDRKTSGAKSILSQKYWEPQGIEDTLIMCPAELEGLFKARFDKIKSYQEKYEFEGANDEQMLLATLLEDAVMTLIWRAAWLGDKSVAAAGAVTAGLTTAGNVKFYNYIDGFWAQIFAAKTAGTITSYYEIAENKEVTPGAQLTLAADRAIQVFENVKQNGDIRIRSNPNAKMYVTDQLFENYKASLRAKGTVYDIKFTMDGMPELNYDGNSVVNCENIWGRDLRADFYNNSTDKAYFLPNRVVYTSPENLRIATLNESDFNNMESWYNRDERKQKIGIGFSLDAKLIEEDLISVAY